MNPIDWLEQNAPGFDSLSISEREAIANFSLLWSFFEARALSKKASSRSIVELVTSWSAQGRLEVAPFLESLTYFQRRYYENGAETYYFRGLNLRRNDFPALVRSVLEGGNTSDVDRVSTLLIILYRIRNNLFHGAKWAYGIRGQLDNFTHANAVLVSALSIVGIS